MVAGPHFSSTQSTSCSIKVINRIETLFADLIDILDSNEAPSIQSIPTVSFEPPQSSLPERSLSSLSTCRSFTSMVMVLGFVHSLLTQKRTTTCREVFYYFVTHFRNQKECDTCIFDVAKLLGVPRVALGLTASPKGWFCGRVQIKRAVFSRSSSSFSLSSAGGGDGDRRDLFMDGMCTGSIQGMPITHEWIHLCQQQDWSPDDLNIVSDAKFILVVEKEGIYTRLSEDQFYKKKFPCILVTGKGFPDLATRILVFILHKWLQIPVLGVCDCNPFGLSVLQTYEKGGESMGIDADLYGVPIHWVGLKPSHLLEWKGTAEQNNNPRRSTLSSHYDSLPSTVFQQMTNLDYKRISKVTKYYKSKLEPGGIDEDNEEKSSMKKEWTSDVLDELKLMETLGFKVELEALHWLGMDYLMKWLTEEIKNFLMQRFEIHIEQQQAA